MLSLISAVSSLFLMDCSTIDEVVTQSIPLDYKTHLVAHRGAWLKNGYNENSYKSVLEAAEIGIWGAEIDIYETSDGKYILNHNPSLFGLDIATSTLEDFKSHSFPNGEYVTTLDEIMEILKLYPDFHLQIEVKNGNAKNISDIISDSHAAHQVVITSFDKKICYDFLNNTALPVMLLCRQENEFEAKELSDDGFWGVSIFYHACLQSETLLNECRQHGLKICVWPPNNINEIAWFIDQGVDFITSDSTEYVTDDALLKYFMK